MKVVSKEFGISILIFITFILGGVLFQGKHTIMIPFILICAFFISFILFKKYKRISSRTLLINILTLPVFFLFISFILGYKYTLIYILFIPIHILLGFALDFWTTSCAPWFKKFPDLERIYLSFAENEDVDIFSVNIPLENDNINETIRLVDSLNYEFTTLYALTEEEAEKLDINIYPYLIFIKDRQIRYKGRLEVDNKIVVNNLEKELLRLLKED